MASNHLPKDNRIPPLSANIDSIYLLSPDGFKEHYLTLLARFPALLNDLIKTSREKRRATIATVYPEDMVERAVERGLLKWQSDGPKGGIWVLSPGNEELVTVLVDEMEALRVQREAGGKRTGAVGDAGGWEVLGEGRRGSEGFLYMLHPPGRGGVDYEIGEKGGRGGRVVVGAGDGRGKGRFGGFGRVLRGL